MSDDEPSEARDEPATTTRRKRGKRRVRDAASRKVPRGEVRPLDDRLAGPRALLAVAAVVACAGVAIVGVGPSELGATLVLLGLVGLVAGVHFVGRMGPA